jgi:hypothetical protein
MTKLTLDQLDWQAVSSFVIGLLALLGALWVGFRQLEITRRQTALAERQTELAALTLRHQLFERRLEAYRGVADFLGALLRDNAHPTGDVEAKFLKALGSSRFLFPDKTHQSLESIRMRATSFRIAKAVPAGGHAHPGGPAALDVELDWFTVQLQCLPNLFGDEMRLSDRRAAQSTR